MLCTIISPSIHCTACICTTPQHPPINRHHQSSCFHQLSSSIHVSTIFDYLPSVDYKLNPDRLYATYFGGDAAQGLEVDVEGDDDRHNDNMHDDDDVLQLFTCCVVLWCCTSSSHHRHHHSSSSSSLLSSSIIIIIIIIFISAGYLAEVPSRQQSYCLWLQRELLVRSRGHQLLLYSLSLIPFDAYTHNCRCSHSIFCHATPKLTLFSAMGCL